MGYLRRRDGLFGTVYNIALRLFRCFCTFEYSVYEDGQPKIAISKKYRSPKDNGQLAPTFLEIARERFDARGVSSDEEETTLDHLQVL